MQASINIRPGDLSQYADLRAEVRSFLADYARQHGKHDWIASWMGHSPQFSKALGERGWIGMTWPKKYGGAERTFLERYVVMEELLASGAPVAAHWIGDRQSGPLLLNVGTEAQRQKYLPGITRGETFFSIGMSEPGSGSDLAAARTKAEKTSDGWVINGQKIWTSNAHNNHYAIVFCRTSPLNEKKRHEGFSQFIVDLKSEGLETRPIENIAGEHHFNEVFFKDVVVADDCLVGEAGNGWNQVTSELAFERSGPERFLSNYALTAKLTDAMQGVDSDLARQEIGRMAAHYWTLRKMSSGVAKAISEGDPPNLEAALVKDLGTIFEQEIADTTRKLVHSSDIRSDEFFDLMQSYTVMHAPSFTLRGGTNEVLRGIIARGMGLR